MQLYFTFFVLFLYLNTMKKFKHGSIYIFVLFIYLCHLHNFKQGPWVQPGSRKPSNYLTPHYLPPCSSVRELRSSSRVVVSEDTEKENNIKGRSFEHS